MKKIIYTKNAPKPIGPYNQAIKIGSLLLLSGQIPINPDTGNIESNDIESQVNQVFQNIAAILDVEDLNFNDIVKTTIYLTDLENFKIVNNIYESYFKNTISPARSTIEVSALPLHSLVEIELIASSNE